MARLIPLTLAAAVLTACSSPPAACEAARPLYDDHIEVFAANVPTSPPMLHPPAAPGDTWEDTARRERVRATARAVADGRADLARDAFQAAHILVQQNPECFTVEERLNIERGHRRGAG